MRIHRHRLLNPPRSDAETEALDPAALIRRHPEASNTYDNEADVLYLSFGSPQPGVGIDVGGGAAVVVNKGDGRIIGITVIGLRRHVERELAVVAAEARVAS